MRRGWRESSPRRPSQKTGPCFRLDHSAKGPVQFVYVVEVEIVAKTFFSYELTYPFLIRDLYFRACESRSARSGSQARMTICRPM
jgi:hypothetical protein